MSGGEEIALLIERMEHVPLVNDEARAMREQARDLVREVLAFHGEALRAMVSRIEKESPSLISKMMSDDPLVASILELHDVAPPPAAIPAVAPPALVAATSLVRKKKPAAADDDDVAPTRAGGNACDLCGAEIGERHGHLLERAKERAVRCACFACALLFEDDARVDQKYRRIPDRIRAASPGLSADSAWWSALGLPIGVAFVTARESGDGARAWYPSPVGATEASVPPDVWDAIVRDHSSLRELVPEVEALIIDRSDRDRARHEHWIVGIDQCWSLVARIRAVWQGMTGGPPVRAELASFFASLHSRAGTRAEMRERVASTREHAKS